MQRYIVNNPGGGTTMQCYIIDNPIGGTTIGGPIVIDPIMGTIEQREQLYSHHIHYSLSARFLA